MVISAVATAGVGVVFLVADAVGLLAGEPPGFFLSSPSASLCFILAGVTLLLWREPGGFLGLPAAMRPKLARWFPATLTAFAFFSWLSYPAGIDYPGRMSSGTAFTFSLIGAAFMIRQRWPRVSLVIVLFFTALIYVTLIWYLYAVASFFGTELLASFRVTSLVAFMILLVGMLLLEVPNGTLQVLVADSPAGAVTRRLIPAGIVVPPLIGYFRLQGELAGLYDTSVGIALFTSALVGVFCIVAVSAARSLNRVEVARREAVAALRESEERFEKAFKASPVPMTMTDLSTGRFLDLNRAAEELLGLPREQALGKSSVELKIFGAEARAELKERLARDGAVYGLDQQIQTLGGEPRTVITSVVVMEGPSGPYLLAVFVDITERKAAEEALARSREELAAKAIELARSNSELEQFAYVASHDLQEPLRMVGSYVQLLERRYKGKLDADADEFINFAVDGARRMQDLINDLLMYSRVGTRGGAFVAIQSRDALQRAMENLQIAIEESGATVSVGELPEVFADGTQLTQLFQNLVSNAIKYRGTGPPRITIAAKRAERQWEFSVSDNGIGIDPKHFDRIFIIFQRLHPREATSGTGIGLAVCKKIVERHGGKLAVESQPGRGATFRFTLPDIPASGA